MFKLIVLFFFSLLFNMQLYILSFVCGNGSKLQETKSRLLNCTRELNITKILLHEDKLARGNQIARKHICTKGHGGSLLHEVKN